MVGFSFPQTCFCAGDLLGEESHELVGQMIID